MPYSEIPDYRLRSDRGAIALVSELTARYQLTSIQPLLEICKATGDRTGLSIAVLGRFKAGKSSFLNHLIGREVLPVGVVPVTSVVTDVGYGPQDAAMVRFAGGRETEIPVQDLTSMFRKRRTRRTASGSSLFPCDSQRSRVGPASGSSTRQDLTAFLLTIRRHPLVGRPRSTWHWSQSGLIRRCPRKTSL